jgi:hypothetical protein
MVADAEESVEGNPAEEEQPPVPSKLSLASRLGLKRNEIYLGVPPESKGILGSIRQLRAAFVTDHADFVCF